MINYPPPRSVREGPFRQLPTLGTTDCQAQPRATPQTTFLTWDLDFPRKAEVPNIQASSTMGGRQGESTVRTSALDSRRQRGPMNHQSHGLPRRILCQPCPKHFPPINSHTSHAVGEALLPSPLTDEEAQREKRKSFIQGHAAGNLGSEPRAHALGHLALLPSPGPAHKPASCARPSASTSNQVLILWLESLLLSSPKSCPGSGTGLRASRI